MYTITYANLWDSDLRKLSAWADRRRDGYTMRYCVGGVIEVIPGTQHVDAEQIAQDGLKVIGHPSPYSIRERA